MMCANRLTRRLILPLVVCFLNSLLLCESVAAEPKTELLWPGGAPGAKGDQPADKPTLTICLPEPAEKDNKTAVIVCPGGGYGTVCTDHEGQQIAGWLNSLGVAAFILDYRHRGRGYGHPAPLEDAGRVIRTVRARAAEWKVDPAKIGMIGFSAGGHLASSAGTHFDRGNPEAADPIQRVSARPDFLILCYAVLAFDEPYTHRGSQHNLLGKDADAKLVRSMSSEKQVTRDTPPAFLWHTDEDTVVPPENSVQFYLALRRSGVPAELHVYQRGQHGLGLARSMPGAAAWTGECEQWMRGLKLLGEKR